MERATFKKPRLVDTTTHTETFLRYLDQNQHILQILSIPFIERLQQLQPLALRINHKIYLAAVFRRLLVSILAGIEASRWQLIAGRSLQLVLFACKKKVS